MVSGAVHKWRQLNFQDFGPPPPRQYQIHATSFLPLVRKWPTPSLPLSTDVICEWPLTVGVHICNSSNSTTKQDFPEKVRMARDQSRSRCSQLPCRSACLAQKKPEVAILATSTHNSATHLRWAPFIPPSSGIKLESKMFWDHLKIQHLHENNQKMDCMKELASSPYLSSNVWKTSYLDRMNHAWPPR